MAIPEADFGRDHWSLLGYIECCCVDDGGRLDTRRMRVNPTQHPGGSSYAGHCRDWRPSWGTRLKGWPEDPSRQLPDHDDIDCLDDLIEAGLVENRGTGLFPVGRLTDRGTAAAAELRAHKAGGGSFQTFRAGGQP